MDRERDVEVLGGGEHNVVVGVAKWFGIVGEGADISALRSRLDSTTHLFGRGSGIAQRYVGGGYQSGLIGSKLTDPPVVRPGVSLA